jgi:hypothetical protein
MMVALAPLVGAVFLMGHRLGAQHKRPCGRGRERIRGNPSRLIPRQQLRRCRFIRIIDVSNLLPVSVTHDVVVRLYFGGPWCGEATREGMATKKATKKATRLSDGLSYALAHRALATEARLMTQAQDRNQRP